MAFSTELARPFYTFYL